MSSRTSFSSSTGPSVRGLQRNDTNNRSRMRLKLNRSTVFGRDKELRFIDELVTNCAKQDAILEIRGRAGSGKSSLIHSQKDSWTADGCLFGGGKYEHHKSLQPFSAIVDALNEICNMWAMLPEGKMEIKAFLKTVENEWPILRYVIPKVFDKAGIDMGNTPLTCSKTGCNFDRMRFALRRFLEAAQGPNRSRRIILFLDDLQWADPCSMQVLKAMILPSNNGNNNNDADHCSSSHGMFLAIAYREEEVNDDHILTQFLQSIKEESKCQNSIHQIQVDSLTLMQTNEIISRLTRKEPHESLELAKVVHNKTGGNAFFVVQFLQLLQDEQHLYYSMDTYKWEWKDVQQIQQAMSILSTNVADMVTAAMEKLPEDTQEALMVASCLGTQVPLMVLTEYFSTSCTRSKSTLDFVYEVFDVAVEAGILRKKAGSDTYEWGHDNLQLAAYSMIPDEDKAQWHLNIGKLLHDIMPRYPEHEWMKYMAADQLDRGSELITDKAMKLDLAKLDLDAAKLSISKAAFFPAFKLLRSGVKFLKESGTTWEDDYDFCMEIMTTMADVEMILNNNEGAEQAAMEILKHAKTPDEMFRAQFIMIELKRKSHQPKEALKLAVDALAIHGDKLRLNIGRAALTLEKLRLRRDFPNHKLEDFPNLPTATSEKAKQLTALYGRVNMISTVGAVQNPNLSKLAALRIQRLTFQYGVTQHSLTAIMGYFFDPNGIKRPEKAEVLTKVSEKLLERFSETPSDFTAMSMTMIQGQRMRVRPFHEILDPLMEAHHVGIATGNLETASTNQFMYAQSYFITGLPLDPLEGDLTSFEEEAEQFGVGKSIKVTFPMFRQMLHNFQGKAANDPTILKGQAMDQEKVLSEMEGLAKSMTLRDISICRLMLACHFDNLDVAAEMVELLNKFPFRNPLPSRNHMRQAYTGLAAFALHRKTGKRKYLKLGKEMVKVFRQQVEHGSINAHPVFIMLKAEEGRTKQLYDEAIKVCSRSGLLHYEALMNERLGQMVSKSDPVLSEFYISRAFELYNDWNAYGKVEQLKEIYPFLNSSSSSTTRVSTSMKARTRYDARDTLAAHKFTIETSTSERHAINGTALAGSAVSAE